MLPLQHSNDVRSLNLLVISSNINFFLKEHRSTNSVEYFTTLLYNKGRLSYTAKGVEKVGRSLFENTNRALT